MSATIQYDENGAVDPIHEVREQKEAVREAQGLGNYSEGGEHVVDPTAMTGTLETSGTTGMTQSADDVSPVFDVANEAFADKTTADGVAEGSVAAPLADPAATGEDAAAPAADTQAADTGSDDAFDASKDPEGYKVAEIMAFLKTASDEDVKKVQKAEKAGQDRSTIANFSK